MRRGIQLKEVCLRRYGNDMDLTPITEQVQLFLDNLTNVSEVRMPFRLSGPRDDLIRLQISNKLRAAVRLHQTPFHSQEVTEFAMLQEIVVPLTWTIGGRAYDTMEMLVPLY